MAKKKKSVLETMTETFPEVAAVPDDLAVYDEVISEGEVIEVLPGEVTPINVTPADETLEEEPGDVPVEEEETPGEEEIPEEEETAGKPKIDLRDPESFSIISRLLEIL